MIGVVYNVVVYMNFIYELVVYSVEKCIAVKRNGEKYTLCYCSNIELLVLREQYLPDGADNEQKRRKLSPLTTQLGLSVMYTTL